MKVRQIIPALDAADINTTSRFWADLLGGDVEADDDWHTVRVDGDTAICVQLAPNHQPPQWPDGSPQQVHLDLVVDDIAQAHEHALAVGARVLTEPDRTTEHGFAVYADPSGHPFCLCW